jgi:FkbM family methyltransferase
MLFVLRLLRPGDVFFDVGANAGAFAVLAASCGCEVVAFEPIDESRTLLNRNVDLNRHLGPIKVEGLAVSSSTGRARMTTALGPANRLLTDEESCGVEVPATTLDAYCQGSRTPTFLKIDVEGHELEVAKGAAGILADPRLLGLLVETFRPHNIESPGLRELETRLGAAGFLPFDFEPETNALRPLVAPDQGTNNTIYLRDIPEIERRLAASGAKGQ